MCVSVSHLGASVCVAIGCFKSHMISSYWLVVLVLGVVVCGGPFSLHDEREE